MTHQIAKASDAQLIANLLQNDGQNLYANINGERTHVRDLCRQAGGTFTSGGTEVERFDFESGPAPVIVAGRWDFARYTANAVAQMNTEGLKKAVFNSEMATLGRTIDLLNDLENEEDAEMKLAIERRIREALLFVMAG